MTIEVRPPQQYFRTLLRDLLLILSLGEFPRCDYLSETYSAVLLDDTTVNLLSRPAGGLFISSPFEGVGLI